MTTPENGALIPSVEAVEYGRRHIQTVIDRLDDWTPDPEFGRKAANMLRHRLVGYPDGGCVVVPFDERWADPDFRQMMEEVRRG